MKNKLERIIKSIIAEIKRKYQKYVVPYISLVIGVMFVIAILASYKVSHQYYTYTENGQEADSYASVKALENTAVSLTGDVILPIDEVDKLPHEDKSEFFWFWAYIISRIIFPAVCLIFIVGIIKKMFRYSLIWVPHFFKTEIAIFGYNDKVGEVIDHSDMDDYKVYLVLNEKLDDEIEEKLFGNGISIIYEPFEKKEYYKYRMLKKCRYFLLMEEDSMKNVALYMAFCQNERNNRIVKDKKPKFYVQCNDLSTEKLMKRYSDRMVAIMENKYESDEAQKAEGRMYISDVELFSYMGILAQKTYAHLPLYQNNIDNKEVGNDVHLFIAGLSEFGMAMLSQALTLGVLAGDSRILVDIVDHNYEDAVRQIQNMMLCFRDGDYGCIDCEVDEGKLWTLTLGKSESGTGIILADGVLEVRVWEAEVLSDRYIDVLEKICDEMPITYAASCFGSSEINIRCVDKLSDVLRRRGEVGRIPLVVNLQYAKGIRDVIKDKVKNYYWFSNVYFTVSDKSDLGLAEIINEKRDEKVKYYNALYGGMYDIIHGYATGGLSDEKLKKEAEEKWVMTNLYRKQSTISQVNAEAVKRFIMSRSVDGADLEAVSALGRALVMMHGKHVSDESNESDNAVMSELKALINASGDKYNAIVDEWAKAEHRRWCYYMLLSGYRFEEQRDDNGDLRHDCLRRWKDMDNSPVEGKKILDMIAYLMVLENSEDGRIEYYDANSMQY